MALGDDLSSVFTEADVVELFDKMQLGGTSFSMKKGGKYEDGATFIIATKYPDGIAAAVHFSCREGCANIRDQLNRIFPHA